jgi:hypothetical protein
MTRNVRDRYIHLLNHDANTIYVYCDIYVFLLVYSLLLFDTVLIQCILYDVITVITFNQHILQEKF